MDYGNMQHPAYLSALFMTEFDFFFQLIQSLLSLLVSVLAPKRPKFKVVSLLTFRPLPYTFGYIFWKQNFFPFYLRQHLAVFESYSPVQMKTIKRWKYDSVPYALYDVTVFENLHFSQTVYDWLSKKAFWGVPNLLSYSTTGDEKRLRNIAAKRVE